MKISEIILRGFRNFKNTKVCFEKNTLIIGENDIGKSNLMYALRILLDKSLSPMDVEPKDSDFYIYEDTNDIYIQIKLTDINEDCVLARLKGHVTDSGESYIAYSAHRENTGAKNHKYWIGYDPSSLTEIDERYYLKAINLKYISSSRDLISFVKRERRSMLQDAKELRSETEISADNIILGEVDTLRSDISSKVNELSYIKKSTLNINKELIDLSFHNNGHSITFDSGAVDSNDFVDQLDLVSEVNSKKVLIGGEGRNNQVFLAIWAARNGLHEKIDEPSEVSFYCVEEPEAHLHPHQQRKLAQYLSSSTPSQIFITTHSPQIAAEFSPNSIVRLCKDSLTTIAANDGCGKRIEESFIQFGYRLNIIPAEAFFAKVVILVEGPSEELFYKALAKALGIDLDRLNVSILMVDGVGFETYIDLLSSLNIEYIVRTDNDVSKVPNKPLNHYAGIKRCLNIYKKYKDTSPEIEELLEQEDLLSWEDSLTSIPAENQTFAEGMRKQFENQLIFLSTKDLENDLVNSSLKQQLQTFYEKHSEEEVVKNMQQKKATTMYNFLREAEPDLKALEQDNISKPLHVAKKLIEVENDSTTNPRTN